MEYRKLLVIGTLIALSFACSLPNLPSLSLESITASGNVITREEALADFEQVDISSSFDVKITQAGAYAVLVRVDDNLVEHLLIEKQGSTLKIGLKPGVSLQGGANLEAEISMPELTGMVLSGASDAEISGFKSTQSLKISLSGSSSLRGDIEAGEVKCDLSGSSDMTLTGSGGNLTLGASGSSDIDLGTIPVVDASLDLSGASSAIVNASERLDVDASEASEVYYLGEPTLGRINTSGASTVEPR